MGTDTIVYALEEGVPYEDKCRCSECERETTHRVVAEYSEDGTHDIEEGEEVWWKHFYRIIQCAGCQAISFQTKYIDSEDFDFGNHVPNVRIQHYPEQLLTQSLSLYELPDELQDIYTETMKAISGDLSILAAAGIRAIVEVLCNERKVEGKNLDQKIDALAKAGIVTSDGAQMLHSLRILGNAAMHEVAPATQQQLIAAFAVVNHMLTGTYILPASIQYVLPKKAVKEDL